MFVKFNFPNFFLENQHSSLIVPVHVNLGQDEVTALDWHLSPLLGVGSAVKTLMSFKQALDAMVCLTSILLTPARESRNPDLPDSLLHFMSYLSAEHTVTTQNHLMRADFNRAESCLTYLDESHRKDEPDEVQFFLSITLPTDLYQKR